MPRIGCERFGKLGGIGVHAVQYPAARTIVFIIYLKINLIAHTGEGVEHRPPVALSLTVPSMVCT